MTVIWQDSLSELKNQMTTATFESILRQSAATCEENDCITVAVPSNRAKEILDMRLRATVERVVNNVAGRPVELSFVVDRKLAIPIPTFKPLVANGNGNGQRENIFDLISANKILGTDWPEPAWIVPQCLPEGLIILAGKPKVGKSWLALQLAQAVSTGGEILGQTVDPGRVLYLALEDPPRRLADRMKKQNWSSSAQTDFMVLGHFDSQIGDLGRGGGEILAQQIRLKGYRLVIIDTFSRSITGDQKDNEIMTNAMDPLQEIAHSQHCAVVMIDHHSKAKHMEMDVVTDIFGSVAKGAMVDTAWGFYRDPGIHGAVLAITGREVNEQKIRLSMNWEIGTWTTEGSSVDNLEMTHRRREVYDALQTLGRATANEIAIAIDQDRGNTYRRLQDMVNAGLATRQEDEHNIFYEIIR